MRVTIRLYKRQDLDLMSLYFLDADYDFKEEVKKTLKQYIAGKPVKNKIPDGECRCVSSMPTKVSFHIRVDDKDKDIKKWLSTITNGRRNTAVKTVFRSSFPLIIAPYTQESENNKFKLD